MWFRLYTDILTSRKVLTLEPELFRAWVICLALTKEGGGLLPPVEDVAFGLRTSTAEAQRLTEALVKCGLLDSDGVHLAPHNWHVRQFESDNSTERVKRFRNVSETLDETAPEQIQSRAETEPEQSRAEASRGKPRSVRAPVLPDDEFLDGLQKNPAYSMLNVRHCYQRMMVWCQTNNKQPSRRRFINWLNREDKPMTAKPGNGAAYVGKSSPPPVAVADPAKIAAQMATYIEELIEMDDLIHMGHEYDAIIKRGGAKAEWEIRCVAYYELHKNEPASPEQVAQLKASISALVPKGGR